MKSRNVVGGGILGALVLGIWLGSFWKGPGLGGSGTESTGQTALDSVQVSTDIDGVGGADTTPEKFIEQLPTDLMTIVIAGDKYRLVNESDPLNGPFVTLDEIVSRANAMTGTPEGIRVRILKDKTAVEGARSDLLATLTENGVKREEIQERADFID